MHYGRCEFRSDGSYVTTLWFVVLYLPIVPIHSLRMRKTGRIKYYGMRPASEVEVLEKSKPHRMQVLRTYALFSVGLVMFLSAALSHAFWLAIPGAALAALPWLLRNRAMERVKAAVEREKSGFSAELAE
jgi:hypothetical protein